MIRKEGVKAQNVPQMILFLLVGPYKHINTPPTIHIFQKQTFMDNKTFKKGVAGCGLFSPQG